MVKQKACKIKGSPPVLITQDTKGSIKEVNTSVQERCLGGIIQQNLQWQAMLKTGQECSHSNTEEKTGYFEIC